MKIHSTNINLTVTRKIRVSSPALNVKCSKTKEKKKIMISSLQFLKKNCKNSSSRTLPSSPQTVMHSWTDVFPNWLYTLCPLPQKPSLCIPFIHSGWKQCTYLVYFMNWRHPMFSHAPTPLFPQSSELITNAITAFIPLLSGIECQWTEPWTSSVEWQGCPESKREKHKQPCVSL